jgi:hypothetical protein
MRASRTSNTWALPKYSSKNATSGGIDANTLLMLHLNNNAVDSSFIPYIMTTSSLSFSNSSPEFTGVFYGVFNGTNTYLQTSTNFASLVNLYTFDFWINTTNLSTADYGVIGITDVANNWIRLKVFGNDGGGNIGGNVPANTISFDIGINGSRTLGAYCSYTANGSWTSIAIVNNSGTPYMFVGGVSQSITTWTGSWNTSASINQPLYIGYDAVNGQFNSPFKGGLGEVRVSNVARWTSNFTPPTSPYTT